MEVRAKKPVLEVKTEEAAVKVKTKKSVTEVKAEQETMLVETVQEIMLVEAEEEIVLVEAEEEIMLVEAGQEIVLVEAGQEIVLVEAEQDTMEFHEQRRAKVKHMPGKTTPRPKEVDRLSMIRRSRIYSIVCLKEKRWLTSFAMLERRSLLRGVSLLGRKEQHALVQSKPPTLVPLSLST